MLGRLIVVVLLAALAFGGGYRTGYSRADAVRRAEVAECAARLEAWKADQAQALAAAERTAREQAEAATARANSLAATLDRTKAAQAAKIRDITRRIPHATAGNTCVFSGEFVRLYNEAIGAAAPGGGDAGHRSVPQAGDSAGAVAKAGAAPAAGAGLRRRAVTPADILGHIRDFGARSQAMEAQLGALIDLLGERQ